MATVKLANNKGGFTDFMQALITNGRAKMLIFKGLEISTELDTLQAPCKHTCNASTL